MNHIIHNDCPNCGAKNKAYVWDTNWEHKQSCCSLKCGNELNDKLKELRDTFGYRKLIQQRNKLNDKIQELERTILR